MTGRKSVLHERCAGALRAGTRSHPRGYFLSSPAGPYAPYGSLVNVITQAHGAPGLRDLAVVLRRCRCLRLSSAPYGRRLLTLAGPRDEMDAIYRTLFIAP